MSIKDLNPPQTRRMFFMSVCHSLSRITEEVYFLGDPNVTAFLKALPLHRFCSTCTAMTCHLYVAENLFTLMTCLAIHGQYFSELECSLSSDMARMSHFCRQWRLKSIASKQSAVCSTCIIPALPVNCQFIWMACAFGMSATQPILG